MSLETVGDVLRWSYANLAMAHAAVKAGASSYGPAHYAIRSRLHAGLRDGTMQVGSLVDEERVKLVIERGCAYCGATGALAVDHLMPKFRGGVESADNIVWACRSCNSQKGTSDVAEWYVRRERFPPLLLLRRYLKLAFVAAAPVLDEAVEDVKGLPFELAAVPRQYPAPGVLVEWVTPLAR